MIFRTNNTEFLRLDAGEDQTKATKHIRFDDNVQARFGTGTDASIRHNGTDWFLQGGNGNVYLQNLAAGKDVSLRANSGSGAEEYLKLDSSADSIAFSKKSVRPDSVPSFWGTGKDLRVQHSGSSGETTWVAANDLLSETEAQMQAASFQQRAGANSGGVRCVFTGLGRRIGSSSLGSICLCKIAADGHTLGCI